MPVYHIVMHCHGSWMPDHPNGFHDRKTLGRRSSDEITAGAYHNVMRGPIVQFDMQQQKMLLSACRQVADRYDWGLHAVAVTATHVHVVLSWRDEKTVAEIYGLLKQLLTRSFKMGAAGGPVRVFSRGVGTVRIRDRDHLIELVRRYFPGHGEFFWVEDRIELKL